MNTLYETVKNIPSRVVNKLIKQYIFAYNTDYHDNIDMDEVYEYVITHAVVDLHGRYLNKFSIDDVYEPLFHKLNTRIYHILNS